MVKTRRKRLRFIFITYCMHFALDHRFMLHFDILFIFCFTKSFIIAYVFYPPSSTCFHSHPIPCVFLYFALKDIDQLKLIMMLVGTPGPELLMKISSDSVSFLFCLSFDSPAIGSARRSHSNHTWFSFYSLFPSLFAGMDLLVIACYAMSTFK